ncbi:MAG: DUF3079 domain-containing protein [Vicinamibacterales bacterium]
MPTPLLSPRHPERICWGCDRYCRADDLACGNGPIRTAHSCELFGDDWLEWSTERDKASAQAPAPTRLRPSEHGAF